MDLVKISCPYCGLSKTIPRDKAPTKPVKANCPKCKHQFPIHPDKLQPAEPAPAPARHPAPAPAPAEAPPPPPPPPLPAAEEIDPHAGLGGSPESIGNLFTQSFGLFSSRFFTLFGLYLLMLVMLLIPSALFGGGTVFLLPIIPGLGWLIAPLGGLITALVAIYFLFWGYGAFVHAVIDQTCGFGEALRRGREQTWAFFWALSLAAFIVLGGYLLFFIPGVVLGVWFMFVPFVIALEKERGMDALLKSRQYVQGHWWNTFFKIFILTLVCGAVGAIPLVGWLLSLVTTPFMLVFIFVMYYDLQQIKGTHPVRASSGEKARYLTVGVLGHLVVPLIIVMAGGGALLTTLKSTLPGDEMPFGIAGDQGIFEQFSQQQQQQAIKQKLQPPPPPQKVLDSRATLSVAANEVKPGGTIFVTFDNIAEPAPKDWIALYRVGDPNEQYGEFDYLDARSGGTISFLAPSIPGEYEARLFLDWPSGGYHDVARTPVIYVGHKIEEPTAATPEKHVSPLDKFRPKNKQ